MQLIQGILLNSPYVLHTHSLDMPPTLVEKEREIAYFPSSSLKSNAPVKVLPFVYSTP